MVKHLFFYTGEMLVENQCYHNQEDIIPLTVIVVYYVSLVALTVIRGRPL